MRTRTALVISGVVILLLVGSIYYGLDVQTGPSQTSGRSGASSSSSALETTSASTSLQDGGYGDWTTYHHDNARTGFEGGTNFTSVARVWTSETLDGAVYAEPLVSGGTVFVATENNSVYALDATSGSVVWRTHLGPPVPGSQLECGDISTSGVTGTPVIDAATSTIFVVVFSHLHHQLFGIDLKTGAVVSNVSADPPGFADAVQQQRSALSLFGGTVYVPYGGLYGDCGAYHGWVVGLPASGSGTMDVYKVPTLREGGIWAPSGAAIDSSGMVYVATGNGASDTTFDHGDSVISLSPSLGETGYFAPENWAQLNRDDADLGSAGPSLVGAGTLFQVGKEGVGYLLDSSRLGGIGGETFSAPVCGGSYGGAAFANSTVFVPCTNGVFALRIDGQSFSLSWHSGSFDSGPPIVTGGVVWSVDVSSSTLNGFSASDGRQLYSFHLGSVVHFCTPSAGDGRLFVASGDTIQAFSLGKD